MSLWLFFFFRFNFSHSLLIFAHKIVFYVLKVRQ